MSVLREVTYAICEQARSDATIAPTAGSLLPTDKLGNSNPNDQMPTTETSRVATTFICVAQFSMLPIKAVSFRNTREATSGCD